MNIASFVPALGVTFKIAFGAWLLGLVAGLAIAMLRELGSRYVDKLIGPVVTFLRAVPELVMLYIIFFGFAYLGVSFGSVTAAIVALGVTESAFLSEYLRGAILTVSPRQRSAAMSLGMSRLQVFRYVILPQAVPFSIPPVVNSFVGLLKTATLAVAIGAAELLHAARQQMVLTGDVLQVALVVVAIYVAVTVPLTWAAAQFEEKARSRLAAA